MIKIAIIIGSTRPNRLGEKVARWVYDIAAKRQDASFELIDLAAVNLPFLDEPEPPSSGKYAHEHTKAWSARIAPFDGFVFVTPEYNHGTCASLKNAIDFLWLEWNNKSAGFVSYGSAGGTRAVEQLRQVMTEIEVADVRKQVSLSLFTDFVDYTELKPGPQQPKAVEAMLDQVIGWGTVLQGYRSTL